MTPLTRWVLLALLLAVVEAHPHEHACVCLCRVQNGGPDIAGVCDDQRIQDLQSGASLHVVRDIFELCLVLIADHETPHLRFPDAVVRRDVWDRLVKRYGCSCDNYRKEESEEGLENTEPNMLNESDGDGAAAPADFEDQRGRSGHLPGDRTKISVAEEKVNAMGAESVNTMGPEDEADSMEDTIDWEVWCVAQCKNGQGGSACICDIIP